MERDYFVLLFVVNKEKAKKHTVMATSINITKLSLLFELDLVN